MKNSTLILGIILLVASALFAAPKSASAYYGDAAFEYIQNRLPSAEITCNEGLEFYPNDQKLQMLLARIKEAKEQQKNENKKNDKNQEQNQDKNQNDDSNQDENNDANSSDSNDSDAPKSSNSSDDSSEKGNSSSSISSSDSEGNGGNSTESSSSGGNENGASSSSNGNENPQNNPAESNGENAPEENDEYQMSPEEAAQLLKDFDEQNGERKPWKPVRGTSRPAKDW